MNPSTKGTEMTGKTSIIVRYETTHMWRSNWRRVDFETEAAAAHVFALVPAGAVVTNGTVASSFLLTPDEADEWMDEVAEHQAESEAEYAWLTAAERGDGTNGGYLWEG